MERRGRRFWVCWGHRWPVWTPSGGGDCSLQEEEEDRWVEESSRRSKQEEISCFKHVPCCPFLVHQLFLSIDFFPFPCRPFTTARAPEVGGPGGHWPTTLRPCPTLSHVSLTGHREHHKFPVAWQVDLPSGSKMINEMGKSKREQQQGSYSEL